MPLFTYCAEVFSDRLSHVRTMRKLQSVRGLVSKTISGSFSTTSAEAAAVLAGIPPIEESIWQRLDARKHLRNEDINRVDYQLPREPRLSKRSVRIVLNERTMTRWQQSWEDSDKGRTTFSFLPDIKDRLNMQHFRSNRKIAQVLTGHGKFNEYLRKIGARDNASCEWCQADRAVNGTAGEYQEEVADNPLHRIYQCKRYKNARKAMVKALNGQGLDNNLVDEDASDNDGNNERNEEAVDRENMDALNNDWIPSRMITELHNLNKMELLEGFIED